jgi:hypothetical protein
MQENETLRARRLLLISAPSILVCRSELEVSAPRSLPTRYKNITHFNLHAIYLSKIKDRNFNRL